MSSTSLAPEAVYAASDEEFAATAHAIFATPGPAEAARRARIMRRRKLRQALLFGFFDALGVIGATFVFAFPALVFGSLVIILVQHMTGHVR